MRFLFIFILMIIINSCNEDIDQSKKIFKYNNPSNASSLDPAFSKDQTSIWLCSNIYDGLFSLNQKNQIEKNLVKSYNISNDGLRYEFEIRDDVFFHQNICFKTIDSTRRVTSHDIVYSFKRLLDPLLSSPGMWVLNNKLRDSIPFEVIDSFKFVINLSKPNTQLISILTMPYCSVVPREAVEMYKQDFGKNPVGTGPFKLKIWEPSIAIFLEKNELYYQTDSLGRSLPYIDFVKASFVEQRKIEYLSLLKGEIDMVSGIDQSFINEVIDQNGNLRQSITDRFNVIKKPFLNTEFIAILYDTNLYKTSHILANKEIRKAVNYAIDKKSIARDIKGNLAYPAIHGIVPIGMPSYDYGFMGYQYNPEKAKEIIKKFSPNKKPKIDLHINNIYVELAEYITFELESVGFEVNLKLHPSDIMTQLAIDGRAEMFRRSWFADYADPENYYACYYSLNSTPPNYTRFKNAKYDKIYEDIIKTRDTSKRKKLFTNLDQILKDNSIFVPLYYDMSVRIVSKKIQGLEQNSMNLLDLRMVNIM